MTVEPKYPHLPNGALPDVYAAGRTRVILQFTIDTDLATAPILKDFWEEEFYYRLQLQFEDGLANQFTSPNPRDAVQLDWSDESLTVSIDTGDNPAGGQSSAITKLIIWAVEHASEYVEDRQEKAQLHLGFIREDWSLRAS